MDIHIETLEEEIFDEMEHPVAEYSPEGDVTTLKRQCFENMVEKVLTHEAIHSLLNELFGPGVTLCFDELFSHSGNIDDSGCPSFG